MTNRNDFTGNVADRELVLSRTVNAPIDLLYRVWTDPAHIAKWWGPNGFTNTVYEMNVVPGGVWRYMMHGPDGTDYPNRVSYIEVVPQQKLVYLHDSGIDNDPNGFHVTVTFEPDGKKTKVTMRSVFATAEVRDMVVREFGAVEGGNQTLNRLEAFIVCMDESRSLTIRKMVEAPIELVFRVWTEAAHLARWWGPTEAPLKITKFELRHGGVFNYCVFFPDGKEVWGKFVYREIEVPSKLVFVSSFSDASGNTTGNPWSDTWPPETLNVLSLTQEEGKTLLTLKVAPINATEAEKAAFAAAHDDMQQGFKVTFAKLDNYLANNQ